jgi:PadR family transcriptional regulator, regulatory protein PadR
VNVDAESRDLVQGTLQMLVLKSLAPESMHGYGIALRIEQISNGVVRVPRKRKIQIEAEL